MGQVHQPGAAQLRVEHRVLDVGGAPRPTFSLLAPAAKAMFTSMPTRCRRVHSASVMPSRTPPLEQLLRRGPRTGHSPPGPCPASPVVLGVPAAVRVRLRGAGRRVQRGHQLQPGDGGGAARRHHPGRVHAEHTREVRRRQLPGIAPVPGGERMPGRNAQLHAGPLRAGGRAVDTGPRPEPPLRQLPLRTRELLDDLVVLGEPAGDPFPLGEGDGQAVALQRPR